MSSGSRTDQICSTQHESHGGAERPGSSPPGMAEVVGSSDRVHPDPDPLGSLI
jgi:hypothetical protein